MNHGEEMGEIMGDLLIQGYGETVIRGYWENEIEGFKLLNSEEREAA